MYKITVKKKAFIAFWQVLFSIQLPPSQLENLGGRTG